MGQVAISAVFELCLEHYTWCRCELYALYTTDTDTRTHATATAAIAPQPVARLLLLRASAPCLWHPPPPPSPSLAGAQPGHRYLNLSAIPRSSYLARSR
jgi:hypothetical protein